MFLNYPLWETENNMLKLMNAMEPRRSTVSINKVAANCTGRGGRGAASEENGCKVEHTKQDSKKKKKMGRCMRLLAIASGHFDKWLECLWVAHITEERQ